MKKKEQPMLSQYEIDNIWMSYRYCIGRGTIAAHAHAGDIANNAYGRMTKERAQFIAKDINQSIYDILHIHDWFDVDYVWNMKNFRPLDIFYQCLNDIGVKNFDDIKKIKSIECYLKDGKLNTDVYYYNSDDKFNHRSLSDITDLEVWQRLANLFDIDNHRYCKLTNGRTVEYYEFWTHSRTEDGYKFYKVKCPIDGHHNFTIVTYIDEQFIEEDDIAP